MRSVYDEYRYDPADGREDVEADGYRVLRGGSWLDTRRCARCAYRGRSFPVSFNDFFGFRVVVSLGRF
jgi:formylglycine-generating enzyme required for sulfatase activity